MYYFGYLMLVFSLLAAALATGLALINLWSAEHEESRVLEKTHFFVSGALLLASAALLHALFWQDYSLIYAASYTDQYLDLFYRLTAFWAGQPGSMLFWTLAIALSGTFYSRTAAYAKLSLETRLWFWALFYLCLVFFLLLLSTYSNPFLMQKPAPADGNGLNPLLQNPGMIIHPPLLFLGYAGFVVPSCLALAQSVSAQDLQEEPWYQSCRPLLILAWIFLTAGILLGAWWAYMELGWGGYWAWDPVENSSLIPWLLGSALLHSLILERRTKTCSRFNVFLVNLCTISTIFATFLVRSGIVDSVHAFGQSSVGTPLLLGVLILGVISLLLTFAKAKNNQPLPELLSREGLLLVMTWFLLAIAFIILIATLWPVLTKLVSKTPAGLDAAFYNRVCLPLAALLLLLLAFGPWLGAKKTAKKTLLPLSGCLLLSLAGLYFFGYTNPVAALAAASGLTIILGIFLALLKNPKGLLFTLKSLGAHLGLALIAIGIAFSGPYSKEEDLELAKGETGQIGDYQVTLEDLRQSQGLGYSSLETPLKVERQGEIFGHLMPERRIYDKFGEMQFSEVDIIPSLGNEIYASLLGLNGKKAVVRVSVKPLVNWLWIGGFLMCLLPLLPRKKTSLNSAKAQEQEVQPKHEA